MGIIRTISIIITPLCVAACGGGGGGDVIQQNIPTTSRATEATTTLLSPYSTTSSIGQSGQIYVLERLSLGAQKRLSAWSNETYQEQITLEHVLIEEDGTIYGTPTPSPAPHCTTQPMEPQKGILFITMMPTNSAMEMSSYP